MLVSVELGIDKLGEALVGGFKFGGAAPTARSEHHGGAVALAVALIGSSTLHDVEAENDTQSSFVTCVVTR